MLLEILTNLIFSFETGNGISRTERGAVDQAGMASEGQWEYRAPDGQVRHAPVTRNVITCHDVTSTMSRNMFQNYVKRDTSHLDYTDHHHHSLPEPRSGYGHPHSQRYGHRNNVHIPLGFDDVRLSLFRDIDIRGPRNTNLRLFRNPSIKGPRNVNIGLFRDVNVGFLRDLRIGGPRDLSIGGPRDLSFSLLRNPSIGGPRNINLRLFRDLSIGGPSRIKIGSHSSKGYH